MATVKPRHGLPTRRVRRDHLAPAIAASLALHALLLSLQFGVTGLGLSLLGTDRTERRASIPTLQAILREERAPAAVDLSPRPPVKAVETVAKLRVPPKKSGESQLTGPAELPQIETTTVRSSSATLRSTPTVDQKPSPPAEAPEQILPKAPDKGPAILATDQEGSWRTAVAATPLPDIDEKARNEQRELEKAKEAELLERNRLEQAENLRKAELARVAKLAEEALERQRIEEGNRAAEQAALAKARLEAIERARQEEEKLRAEQAAISARRAAAAQKIEAAVADSLNQPMASSDRAGEGKRQPEDRGTGNAAATTTPAQPQTSLGSSLASRALEQARSRPQGLVAGTPVEQERRGRILGRDPRDIQLAFYGEGWRQKIERIGSLNYPRLSKGRHYEPLVVTVSINSDGTLAGLRIDKSSGHKDIDDAVRRIVEMSAPFSAFPPDLKRSYDVVDITRTWSFLEERPRIYNLP